MISDFKDKHLGETCIIIGNGPSLNLVPKSFLNSYKTFGQNKIYLMEDFTPSYYVLTDPSNIPAEEFKLIDNLDCPKFIRYGWFFKNENEFRLTRNKIFQKDFTKEIYEGYSVTFVSLQLAYYMGFSTVLLVGVDHRYTPYDSSKELDPNHFHSRYHGITNWSKSSLEKGAIEIPKSMLLAKEAYESDNRKIINLTDNSELKVFEFGKLEDWIKDEARP